MPSWSQKIEAGENFSSGFLESEFFGAGRGGVSRYTATPLIVALSPGHSDITRFRPWSPIATGNHLDRAEPKKFKNLLRRMAPLTFFIRVQAFRNSSLDPAFRRSTRTSTQRIRKKKILFKLNIYTTDIRPLQHWIPTIIPPYRFEQVCEHYYINISTEKLHPIHHRKLLACNHWALSYALYKNSIQFYISSCRIQYRHLKERDQRIIHYCYHCTFRYVVHHCSLFYLAVLTL